MEKTASNLSKANRKNDLINYNLDHLYCHTNDSNYIRADSGTDMGAIRKEIKQLKAMLLLHLDLIKEQSDQLMSKDKVLANLKHENEMLKMKIERLDRRAKICKKDSPVEEKSTCEIPETKTKCDILKKISTKLLSSCSLKLNTLSEIVEDKYNLWEQSADTNKHEAKLAGYTTVDNVNPTNESSSVIGEVNGKFINKIVLQRVQTADSEETLVIKTDSSNQNPTSIIKFCDEQERSIQCSQDTNQNKIETVQNFKRFGVSTENEQFNREMLRCHNEDVRKRRRDDHDEYAYADSTSATKRSYNRYITTANNYRTREWQMEELEAAVNQQITEMGEERLNVDVNLEIPRWTIKSSTPLYSIEGTENVSEEAILKRHARLEHHEKKRKKWDVQRIREQRTIERLKRRHCKDELLQNRQKDPDYISSFYPPLANIRCLNYTNDLPVLAFGEEIPLLNKSDFSLPWHHKSAAAHHSNTDKTSHHTSIVLTKKKIVRRHYTANTSWMMPSKLRNTAARS